MAGLAARRLPGAGAALAGAQRDGPRPVAGVPRHHRGLDRADARRAVAGRGAGGGAAADPRRRGLPAGAGRAAGRRRPRGVEHLRPDRGHRRRLRAPSSTAGARCASGCRCAGWDLAVVDRRRPAGGRRRGRRAGDRRRRAGPLPRPGQGRREVRADADAGLGPRLPQRRPGPAAKTTGCSSGAAPTTRSRSAAGASSSARSTPRCVHLPGVSGGAAAVRRTASGTPMLVGYVVSTDPEFDLAKARHALAETLPAALVPRLVRVDELPTRTSGKVDRDALPWPPPGGGHDDETPDMGGTMGWLAGLWRDLLGAVVDGPGSRLLRPRRRLAVRRAAGRGAAATLSRRSPSPTSTTIRGWARWPSTSTSSSRRRRSSSGWSGRPRCSPRPRRCCCRCRWPR